jgi:uncharacterized membrane protein
MRFLLLLLSIFVLGFIVQSFLPWWSIIVVAGIVSLFFDLSTTQRFLAAFLAAFLLWGIYAGYINQSNGGILAERMGQLLGGQSGFTMVLASATLGGLFSGLGALTASLGASLINSK